MKRASPLLLPLAAAGCAASPAQNVLGAFFPSWLLCGAAGAVLAALARQLCVLAGLERHLLLAPLVYACLALSAAILFWLPFFGNLP